jgi:transposase
LGRESNQKGAIRDAIESYSQNRKERFEQIQAELTKLKDERQRIEASIQELEAELKMNKEPEAPTTVSPSKPILGDTADFPAAPHILRLLRERGADSRTQAVDRKWLDDQLVHRVEELARLIGMRKTKSRGGAVVTYLFLESRKRAKHVPCARFKRDCFLSGLKLKSAGGTRQIKSPAQAAKVLGLVSRRPS